MTVLADKFEKFCKIVLLLSLLLILKCYHFRVNTFLSIFLAAFRFGTPDKTPVLLTFLKTLPEEVQSSHLRIGENRRRAINTELAQKTQAVIHFLVSSYYITFTSLTK